MLFAIPWSSYISSKSSKLSLSSHLSPEHGDLQLVYSDTSHLIMINHDHDDDHIDKQEDGHDDDNHVDDQDHGDDHIDKQEEDHDNVDNDIDFQCCT